MSLTQLGVPDENAVVFAFEPQWSPEGFYRVTLWRDFCLHDFVLEGLYSPEGAVATGPLSESISVFGGSIGKSIVWNLRGHLLTTLPIQEEEAEGYFSEVLTHGFKIGIYNTRNPDDVLSILQNGDPRLQNIFLNFDDLRYPNGVTFVGSDSRLLYKFIKPFESTRLFGKWEFLPHGETVWDTPEVGECQNAIEGQDYRWYHGQDRLQRLSEENPYLDERQNAPLDAEQIFDLQFNHVVHSVSELVPVKPSTTAVPIAGSWTMPMWDWTDKNMSTCPWVSLQGDRTGLRIAPGSVNLVSLSTTTYNARWVRHIDARYWLQLIFDFQFGVGKWAFTCDDAPIRMEGAKITNGPININSINSAPSSGAFHQAPASTVGGSATIINVQEFGRYFIPQSIFGVLDDDVTARNIVVPVLTNSWPKYHQSQNDAIREFCLMHGWIPLVDIDKTTGFALIHFKARTQPFENIFSGPVPISAKPHVFPESENGISVVGLKTFLNAQANDGWYDDILAFKRDPTFDPAIHESMNSLVANPNVSPPQANPYVVPATAKKPAVLEMLMRCGGWQYIYSGGVEVYGTYTPQGTASFSIFDEWDFPMVTPLVPGEGAIPQTAFQNDDMSPLTYMLMDFQPVIRAEFDVLKADGTKETVSCRSLRQALARFYATLFVSASRKYNLEDPTINKFATIDSNGDRTGTLSYRNCRVFYQRLMPDGRRAYVKHITRDPNANVTSTELLRFGDRNEFLTSSSFHDETEETGKLHTETHAGDGGPDPKGAH